ncbi:MAG: hypothetical protein JRG92_18910 [Deltaproteobacteria bacterium]|nr:hypothetical protein [Deltaproteobacteria bacterium]
MSRVVLIVIACWLGVATSALAADDDASEPMQDVRPPFGVVGGTVFTQGTVTFSYRFERLALDGLMNGDDELPIWVVASDYEVVPTKQNDNAHVFELTWTPFEEVTFLFALPYHIKTMDQLYMGQRFTSDSQGLGDLDVLLLYRVMDDRRSRTHLTLGLSFPTGSIDQTDLSPAAAGGLQRLPYSMQLGSGTVDVQVGFTYSGKHRGTYWGGQIEGELHAGTNANDYQLGHSYAVSAWAGQRWFSWLGTSFRLGWYQRFNVNGADPLLDPILSPASPANDPAKQAMRRLDVLFGLDFYFTGGGLEGTRISVEAGLPAYQNLDGPQLRPQWLVNVGFRHVF